MEEVMERITEIHRELVKRTGEIPLEELEAYAEELTALEGRLIQTKVH